MSSVADTIKRIRLTNEETQAKFAERMGVTVAMQKSYETGRAEPNILYMDKIKELQNPPTEVKIGLENNYVITIKILIEKK